MGEKMLARNALLVDDSKSARFVLGKLLQQHDFNVEMVASAEDALEFLTTHQPDAIFMDHLMKGMDGLVAASVIKKNPATAHIPIVMCTSNDGEEYLAEAKLHGALGTLVKPPSEDKLEEILIAINKAIDNNQPALEKFRPHLVAQPGTTDSEQFEQTAVAAESITESQIEAIVESMINTRIVLIEESLEAQLKRQRDELDTLLRKNIEEIGSASMSTREIENLLDERLAKMSEQVADQLISLKETLGKDIVSSVTLSRHVQEIATETAISVVEEKAKAISRSVTQSVQTSIWEAINPALDSKISQQLAAVEKSAHSKALTFSILAAIVGAGTAAALFFLAL
ncbi:MAG TPA: response regulator [Gammaproteobacteria bacterium]|nr:response regulator [Gammaproteobacteria bacterium]